MSAAREIVERFVRARPALANATGATSQCRIAGADLVDELSRASIPARAVWVRGHRRAPTQASARALAADRHLVVRLQPGFVDVTGRQYDPSGPHPTYYSSEGDLARDWHKIDDGPTEGQPGEERWRPLTLAPWTTGRTGKGFVSVDGTVHVWGTDTEDAPHHAGGAMVLGIEEPAISFYFVINQLNELTIYGDPAQASIVLEALPGLRLEPQGWPF